MYFSEHVLNFHKNLDSHWKLPKGVDLIFPYDNPETLKCMDSFYSKYYKDKKKRHFLFGINPGRLGAGVTGVPFTDPVLLESECKIKNDFSKKHELSSIFIYEIINAFGGPKKFYKSFYISSVCPLGFTKEGKNYNYYDDAKLIKAVKGKIISAITNQTVNFCNSEVAFSIGQGKNYKFLKDLNDDHKWFNKVVPLPHPRWVMQYKRKTKAIYIDEYLKKLPT